MFKIEDLVRSNIKEIVPYSSARDDFKGDAKYYLDANENSLGSPLDRSFNRYPDPHQWELKEILSPIKGVPSENIFLGNGSDECIDLLFRAFCNPGKDNVIINPPTYGMYEISARVNDIAVRSVTLSTDFQLDLKVLEEQIDTNTKLIWICSPNNPTGNSIHPEDIELLLNNYDGLVVVDEAYINFSRYKTFIRELGEYPNLVVLQTLSKAWGLAGIRLGMAFASQPIIDVLNRIKPPYNISQTSQEIAGEALHHLDRVNQMIRSIVDMRESLAVDLASLPFVQKVYPSDANFLLVKVVEPKMVYHYLLRQGIVVRDRSQAVRCEGCLRITVGTGEENGHLIEALRHL